MTSRRRRSSAAARGRDPPAADPDAVRRRAGQLLPDRGRAADPRRHRARTRASRSTSSSASSSALGHSIEDIELVVLTHQHIDHLGLVEIIAAHSGAEVAAIDVVVPFIENFGDDAERDDEFAAALMLRHGIPEDVVDGAAHASREASAPGARRPTVTRPLHDGETARASRPRARGPAPARAQPLRHALLGRRAADPDLRRPPDRPHLLQPADLPPARRLRRAPAGAGHLHRVAAHDPGAAGRDRPPRPRRADHRPRRADRRALRAAPAPRREDLRADRRAPAHGLRDRPGAVGQRRRDPGLPDALRGDRPRRPAGRRRAASARSPTATSSASRRPE